MYKTKQQIDKKIETQELIKIPLWVDKVDIKTYNSLSNKTKLDIVYSYKYKTYAVIETIKPYNILFYMIKKVDSYLTVKYIKDLNDRIKALYQ